MRWLVRGFGTLYVVAFLSDVLLGPEGSTVPALNWVVALGMIGFLLYTLFHTARQALGIFHPAIRVTCDRRTVRPGEEFTLRWTLGERREVRSVVVTVEARRFKREEGSAYPRHEQVFTEHEVLTSLGPFDFKNADVTRSGSIKLAMPEDAPVTRSRHLRWQAWLVMVHAEIVGLPDLHEEFELRVRKPPA